MTSKKDASETITYAVWTATRVREGLEAEERESISLSGSETPFSRNQSRAASSLRNFLCLEAEKFVTCASQSFLDKQQEHNQHTVAIT